MISGSLFAGFYQPAFWLRGLVLALVLAAIEGLFLVTFRRALGGMGFAALPMLLGLAALRLPVQWVLARHDVSLRTRMAFRLRLRLLRALRRRQVSCEGRDLRMTLRSALSEKLPKSMDGWQAGKTAVAALLQLAVLIPVAVWAAPGLIWFFLPITLPAYALVRLKSKVLRRRIAAFDAAHARVESHTDAWLEGLEGLMANGQMPQVLGQDQRRFTAEMQEQGRWQEAQTVFPAWMELFFFVALALVAAWATGRSLGSGLHEWVILGGALLLAYRPLRDLAKAWPHFLAGQSAAHALQNLYEDWRSHPPRRKPVLASGLALQVVDVHFRYPQGELVLQGCHADFPLHGITGITAPNGAGKTTLLRLLAGIEMPNMGEVRWPQALHHHGHVAYLPQRLWLPPDLGERCEEKRRIHPERFERLEALLETRALRQRAHFDVREFSGGERQRLALLFVLMSDAPFILLDEPTAFLPGDARREILKGLLACWREADGLHAPPRGGVVVAHEPFLNDLCDVMYKMNSVVPVPGLAVSPSGAVVQ